MKIGYDAKRAFHNRSGLGNYSRDLIRILAQYFPEYHYYLYNPKKAKVNFELASNTSEILPKGKFWKTLSSLWRQKGIIKQLKEDNITIYHGLSGEIPSGIHKTNIKTVVTIHDLIFIRLPHLYKSIDRKIYFKKFKYAAEKADLIIAISEETKRDIVKFLGIDPKKIIVIYQGCNNAYKVTYSKIELDQTKNKFNLPDKYVLNVGTVEERKNLLNLIKAVQSLDIDVVVIGNTKSNYAKEVKQYIEKNHLTHRIHFLKNVETKELAQIYQMAKIFVYPSLFEGFGIPIIEALFSKTPVITSKGSCFPEAGGPSSSYIDPNKVEEIKSEIVNILHSNEKQKHMITEGLSHVEKFKDNLIAEELLKAYKSVL